MPQTALSEGLRAAEAEIAAGNAERALELCQQLQTRYPRALHVQRVLGESYLALRKLHEALGALDRALAGNPEDARACCARAIVQQIQGDPTTALAWYHRACDISPDDAMLRAAYGELAAGRGQPPYAPTRVGLARLYLRGDLYDLAIREWEGVLAEQPDHLEAQVGLAEVLWRAGRMAAAADRCRRTLANVPSCVKPMLILAAIEYDSGRNDDAQRILRRVAELDPDMRLAQTLFADRLAAGDSALRALIFGEPGFAHATGAPVRERTPSGRLVVRSQPVTSQPLGDPAVRRAASPGTQRPPMPPVPPVATPAGVLPPDFHTIFAETEYMLWDRDEDPQARQAMGTPAASEPMQRTGPQGLPASAAPPAAGPGLNGDTAAHMAAFVPPAMRQAGMTMDETEARAAINWISWLRAQGARAHGAGAGAGAPSAGMVPGAIPNIGPLPPMAPAPGSRLTRPVPPVGPGALPTGPLPPPSPEALRQMFAELGDDTTSSRIVEGQVIQSSAGDERPALAPDYGPEDWDEMAARPIAQAARDAEEASALDSGRVTSEPEDAQQPQSQSVTLEELEGTYSGSGFRAVELHPGDLALLAGQNGVGGGASGDGAGLDEPRLPVEERGASPRTTAQPSQASPHAIPAAAAAAPTTPEPEPMPAEREPVGYAERLERARRRRDDGALPEAVNDYRLILKNAPDLLPQVLDDLDELLAAHADQPEVHRLVGDARIRQGDYLSAIEAYNRAVALSQAQND